MVIVQDNRNNMVKNNERSDDKNLCPGFIILDFKEDRKHLFAQAIRREDDLKNTGVELEEEKE